MKIAWALWLACLVLFYGCAAHSEELPQELAMPTDVGAVVLTVKDCLMTNKNGFNHAAYATEKLSTEAGGTVTHDGCWYIDHDIVNIWFYEENLIATYKAYHFKPR